MKHSKRGVPLTRCSETMTEKAFFSWIRSHARRLSLKWKPRSDFLKEHRRPYIGDNKRTKWEYQCRDCLGWFIQKNIEVNHIIQCGSITCFGEIGGFYERLLCEKDGYEILCKECHRRLTNKQLYDK
jgi:hypothetical protein